MFSISFASSVSKFYQRYYPVGNYLLKVNNRNIRTRCEICSNSKLTKRHQKSHRSVVFCFVLFLLLNFNTYNIKFTRYVKYNKTNKYLISESFLNLGVFSSKRFMRSLIFFSLLWHNFTRIETECPDSIKHKLLHKKRYNKIQ